VIREPAVFLLLVALFLPSSVSAYKLEETWERTFSVEDDARFVLENVNGSIEVDAWDGSEISVRAEIVIKARSRSKAEELFEKMEFKVEERDDYVRVEADLPRMRKLAFLFGERSSILISYEVMVPRRVCLNLRSVNGHIEAEGTEGSFDLHSVNGAIDLHSMSGEGYIDTVNGSITCSIAEFPRNGQLDIKTTNGGVQLRLPEDVDGKLDAKTWNGGIDLDIPLTKSIRVKRGRISGVLGEGGGAIKVRTLNGGISIEEI
jgi:hypothetical protein